jgi:ubiquinone/menaquinone biosynthesis C-methylase UbiE
MALAAAATAAPRRVIDVGCGRGTTTLGLTRQYPAATITAIDQSSALLAVTRGRLRAACRAASLVVADFHRLPFPADHADLAVAAFCLYHSPRPNRALAAIARCVRPGGHLVVVTKSADSYRAIDAVIAASGLDPEALCRPSLYRSFHSGNAEAVLRGVGLLVARRIDQEHTFQFDNLGHLAEYASTCPKYKLPDTVIGNTQRLAAALRRRLPDTPVSTMSTVTYVVAARA